MHQSSWDLEVHVKETQRRRFREADRARQIAAARQGGDGLRMQGAPFSFSRLIAAVRRRFSPQPIPGENVRTPAFVAARLRPLVAGESGVTPNIRTAERAEPYAGMMVLARGTSAPTAAQPCAAGDC